jgi:hypothetical protein
MFATTGPIRRGDPSEDTEEDGGHGGSEDAEGIKQRPGGFVAPCGLEVSPNVTTHSVLSVPSVLLRVLG